MDGPSHLLGKALTSPKLSAMDEGMRQILLALSFLGVLVACQRSEEMPTRELTALETEQLTPKLMPHVQACVVDLKAKSPEARERVELVFRIQSSGKTSSYTEHAPSSYSKQRVDCVNDRVAKLELDLPEGSGGGTLSVELAPE